jgi:hypothetical protein
MIFILNKFFVKVTFKFLYIYIKSDGHFKIKGVHKIHMTHNREHYESHIKRANYIMEIYRVCTINYYNGLSK